MKIIALAVVGGSGGDSAKYLSDAQDLSDFGFFQRSSIREFIVFISKTVVSNTQPGGRQTVEHEEADTKFHIHVYKRPDGLSGVALCDAEYPPRVAFTLLNRITDDYLTAHADWEKKPEADCKWPELENWLQKYQDPHEADSLMKMQKELDETKIVLHKTIETVLERGQKIDTLVEKSNDLSASSKMFYKQAKKQNRCCVVS